MERMTETPTNSEMVKAPLKFEEILKNGTKEDLIKCQKLLLETFVSGRFENTSFRRLRDEFLAKIAMKIDKMKAIYEKKNNVLYVCEYIDKSYDTAEGLLENERCLYSLLPVPWNRIYPCGVLTKMEVAMERMTKISKLDNSHGYMEWRTEFMALVGALNCPVVVKIEALTNALGTSFRHLKSFILSHGTTFYTYYLLIKELERLCWNPKLCIFKVLEEAYNNDYKIGSREQLISFACKLKTVMNIIKVSELTNLQHDVLKSCYRAMGHQKNVFIENCAKRGNVVSLDNLMQWIHKRIDEMSKDEISNLSK